MSNNKMICEFTRKISSSGSQLGFSVPIDELRKQTLVKKKRYFVRIYDVPNVIDDAPKPIKENPYENKTSKTNKVLLKRAFDLMWDELTRSKQAKLMENPTILKAVKEFE